MNTREIAELYRHHPAAEKFLSLAADDKNRHILLDGLVGSAAVFPLAVVAEDRFLLVLTADEETATYYKGDFESLLGEEHCLLLKGSCRKPLQPETADNNLIQERSEVILSLMKGQYPKVLISWMDAFAELAADKESLDKNRLELSAGETLDLDFIIEVLNEYHFSREDFVYEPGQFSIRGGIIDIFSYSHDLPYRFELNGRLIESIRLFDPVTQLSVKEVRFAGIVPDLQHSELALNKIPLTQLLPDNAIILLPDSQLSLPLYSEMYQKAAEKGQADLYRLFEPPTSFAAHLQRFRTIEINKQYLAVPDAVVHFNTTPQPSFNRQFKQIAEHFAEISPSGQGCFVFSESSKQVERLFTIFEDMDLPVHFQPVYKALSQGFYDRNLNLAFYTEHQLFGRHFQYRGKNRYSKNQALTLKELQDLMPGDFVVHVDHGIGKFQGLQKLEVGGKKQEAVRILYKNGDLLYVNINALHKISKYTGKDGTEPKLNKLGSDAWQNLKTKTKKQVKDIARDLIKLYAARKAQPGFSYSPDNYLQLELEASFLYEDTPDQSKATEDIKADMESPHPMDRLVCGDVGFGKTEVAIRAAFKAACDSRQAAVLVPTTILAQQHYRTFRNRFEGLPVNVDYINRFRTAKQQKETLKKLEEGKVDIIIGTHRLLGKDIKFKDLGLLIIDEEQKFGVAAKEKLKQLRVNVDTLTLTATPIPRTLHFSLMGARDLSIINTPPPNRQPVKTELHTFSKDMLREAVDAELNRGGQVFVVHNRVKDIGDLANIIRQECPHAKVAVAHGQMQGDELENIMVQFVEGEYDVLVATTIIESGLDIPNANTIIINNAHFFGLSDLHQMRGRVGRSNKKAYCYLFCPPVYTLTEDARRRLLAIEEFSELGSGFNVAMRDLDIRGAGNLLGGEQSGFIAEIGFDMYHKILDEAIQELKHEEFADVFEDEDTPPPFIECAVETDLDAMIPDEYVRHISERLSLYSTLSRIKDSAGLQEFVAMLTDRFGPMPRQVARLLDAVRLKWLGESIGFEKIVYKNNTLLATFTQRDEFFTSAAFQHIVQAIQQHAAVFQMKQNKNALSLVANNLPQIEDVLLTLQLLQTTDTANETAPQQQVR